MTLKITLAGAGLALAVNAVSTLGARAAVTYSYTGADFTNTPLTSTVTPPATYATSDFVTGSFVLPAALGDNLSGVTISPTSFSFSDGVQTINNLDATTHTFAVWTNGSGQIVSWHITMTLNVATTTNVPLLQESVVTEDYPVTRGNGVEDEGIRVLCGPSSFSNSCSDFGTPFYNEAGFNTHSPGTWRVEAAPEPATWAMMLTGVFMIGAMIRSRRAAMISSGDRLVRIG